MNYFFYFIHPAKYHAFRLVINKLIAENHNVDIAIISKDIVEELVKREGWNYTNIFPEGRRIPRLHTYLSAAINLFRTLYRLFKLMKGKKYDLIITDDLATIVGRFLRVPSIFFTDDDLKAVPESVILIATANYILCPSVTYMGRYSKKKIGYYGFKSLAHLHPNNYTPQTNCLLDEIQNLAGNYFLIRCVSVSSTHDVGKNGIDNKLLFKLVKHLERYGKVLINTERVIPKELQSYVYPIDKMNMSHYLYYAKLFISDSTTMCAEACVLGTPSIEIDDWFADFEQYKILSKKYKLLNGFYPRQDSEIFNYIDEILSLPNLNEIYSSRREVFLKDHIDLSKFMTWLFKNYPESVATYFNNPDIQNKFK
jgi:Uncharacterized protein conserved in archaea